ncbi:phenylalanine--tRNA ligase subunit beta [Corallincola holothuriorum]|uniref:Phenylalanine--tRNA ligase beta subunit n=1 Tax=Corallincola holothuriorum TaxID=2282215 RepID=A0A368NQ02_9GAMM|nr:phenylalanine--tRNA ligase subunit beta [Corallincola holothuriorum]RCU52622.1 phenylalanine--tRNA ligase subunit beta [Corallincola holothuriorum]
MKFSEQWLREWVSPKSTSDELAEQITMAGLEVDEIVPVAGEFTGIVIGEVVSCAKHPEADKLQVTKIDVGDEELLDIVCGAANCRQGLKVAVATVGAVLPGNFKIKKAKLRGQPSFGMLCSEEELGMAESADGILELPLDAPVGQSVRDYLQLDDSVIDVDLTTNRADCLSITGLAREVGVLNQIDVQGPVSNSVETSITDVFPISVSATEACPRYLGQVIKSVDVTASTPLWMVEKLRRCGIRSIDPIVDITNYVLLELGQPMHAFDLAKLDAAITVRMAEAGESLTLLDGNSVELRDDTLVIADASGPVAMAGIFGGERTGVNADTQDILLECAFFSPLAITGKARTYGLHTDSSHRFERGVDPELQYRAMARAIELVVEICGGQVGPLIDRTEASHLPTRNTIELRQSRLARLLGCSIPNEQVTEILQRLGMAVELIDGGWSAVAPSFRFDIAIEEDLIEEIARVYGYNNIPNIAPAGSLVMGEHQEAALPLAEMKKLLVSRDYQEAITYSFVDPKAQAVLHPEAEAIVLPHPISVDMSAMRVSLWSGLLQAVKYNQNRQQTRVRIFESGLRFLPNGENLPDQQGMIAGAITGGKVDEHWDDVSSNVDFFDLKGEVEALLSLTSDAETFSFKKEVNPALHPGQSARIYRGDVAVGWCGALHPQVADKLGIDSQVFLFELSLSSVLQRKVPEAAPVSRFPANRRDIAIVVEEQINAADLINASRKVGGNQLVGIDLFDVYRGKGIPDGHKSLALALRLQDNERTLEENEMAAIVQRVVDTLSSEYGACLRD